MSAPFYARWSGEAFEPLPRHHNEMNATYVVGQVYRLEEIKDRSVSSHNHEFGWLTEAWRNLPENLAELYPSPEHLRKRALIQAGYYTETAIDAGTKAAAWRVAAGVKGLDEFAHVLVEGPIVLVRRAKSQSRRKMDAKTFQASKQAIMDVIAEIIGVSPDELSNARAA